MLHHFLSLSLNLKKLRYHQKMPLLLPPPPAIRVTKHLMLKKRERLLLSSLLSRRPSQQVPVQTGKLVSTAHAVQLQWVHVHGAAWLGPTVTCALVRSSVSEEHAVGVCRELPAGLWFCWPRTPQITHRPPCCLMNNTTCIQHWAHQRQHWISSSSVKAGKKMTQRIRNQESAGKKVTSETKHELLLSKSNLVLL